MLHAVIMAGGSGTRFWPASRAQTPKQMLALAGDTSMIRQTFQRLGKLVPASQTLVVTNRKLTTAIRQELPELAATAVLGEPCQRNTAPCIGLAALLIQQRDPDAIMAVMPADHVIRDTAKFQTAIQQAADLVAQHPTRIITFGIPPHYPATAYGYIQRDTMLEHQAAPSYRVRQFREKPDAATAAAYLESGAYYWNAGIFVWKAETILTALAARQPQMFRHLEKIVAAWGSAQQEQVFDQEFSAIEGISIDYAVMEHATEVVVMEAPFDWDDVGSWQSLSRLEGTDAAGNTLLGKHLEINTQDTIVRSTDEHLVVTLGVQDLIVVHTPDATLVAHKQDEEAIRQVVQQLDSHGWQEYL